jgi:hypothetical protein
MAGDGIKLVKGKQALISAGKGAVHPASLFFFETSYDVPGFAGKGGS